MPLSNFPQEVIQFEIQAYKKPKSITNLRKTHVPFSGAPHKHPFASEKVILVVDPYSSNTIYYEFNADDISFVEELPSIANMDGEVVTMARIWVEKRSVGVRSTPFVVEDTMP